MMEIEFGPSYQKMGPCTHRPDQSQYCSICIAYEAHQAKQPAFNKPLHKNLTWVYLKQYAEEVVVRSDPNASIPVTNYNSGVHITPEQDQVQGACYLLREEATKTEVYGKPTLATLHVCTEHVVIVDWTAY